jgi:hypothetical protein
MTELQLLITISGGTSSFTPETDWDYETIAGMLMAFEGLGHIKHLMTTTVGSGSGTTLRRVDLIVGLTKPGDLRRVQLLSEYSKQRHGGGGSTY